MEQPQDIKEFIWALSKELRAMERTMDVPVLAERLNAAGFRTRYGHEYQGLRGTYRLVRLAWQWVESRNGKESGKPIADAFVLPSSGKPAWEH